MDSWQIAAGRRNWPRSAPIWTGRPKNHRQTKRRKRRTVLGPVQNAIKAICGSALSTHRSASPAGDKWTDDIAHAVPGNFETGLRGFGDRFGPKKEKTVKSAKRWVEIRGYCIEIVSNHNPKWPRTPRNPQNILEGDTLAMLGWFNVWSLKKMSLTKVIDSSPWSNLRRSDVVKNEPHLKDCLGSKMV